MMGMKGKMLKKLKSMKPVGYLAIENRVLQVSSLSNGYFLSDDSIQNSLNNSTRRDEDPERNKTCRVLSEQEDIRDRPWEKENLDLRDKNGFPKIVVYRKPDMDSLTLFDPELLAAFHRAVAEYYRIERESSRRFVRELEEDQELDPLLEFEAKCPPGGSEIVILYTTTLRGIRKTFEGCGSVRFLLESFRVAYFERDVSMHAEFRDELRRVMGAGGGRAVPPRLFVKGRYIGGAEEVLGLHEQGRLRGLLRDVPRVLSNRVCEGCGGIRFVVCGECSGSRKVVGEDGYCNVCTDCNENGLVLCPLCCC